LLTTAFINKDKSIVIVIMNQSDKEVNYTITLQDKMAKQNILPHAIQSIVLNKK